MMFSPKGRYNHSAPAVGDSIFVWTGSQPDCPNHHDSPFKRLYRSSIDILKVQVSPHKSIQWSSQQTNGTPPLGISGYRCTVIGSNIYYFGGWCGHDICFHNDLTVLDTQSLKWTQLQPGGKSGGVDLIMKRGYGGLVALEDGGVQYLITIGGVGSTPAIYYPQYQYINRPTDSRVRTNECNMYSFSTGQWAIPNNSGQYPLPISSFVIEKVNNSKAVLFGGYESIESDAPASNTVYFVQLSGCSLHWESIKPTLPDGVWPMGRGAHASIITNSTLVVLGGKGRYGELLNDCWLLDMLQMKWKEMTLGLPPSMTQKYFHSLSCVQTAEPHCWWLVVIGGANKSEDRGTGGMKGLWYCTYVEDTVTMAMELVFKEDQWTIGPAFDDSYNIKPLYSDWRSTVMERRDQENVDKIEKLNESTNEPDKISIQKPLPEQQQEEKKNPQDISISVDISSMRKKIIDVLIDHHTDLYDVFDLSLVDVANQLFQARLIASNIQKKPSFDDIIYSFKASLKFKRTLHDMEEHCSKFLTALFNVGGPVSDAAQVIKEKWIQVTDRAMQF